MKTNLYLFAVLLSPLSHATAIPAPTLMRSQVALSKLQLEMKKGEIKHCLKQEKINIQDCQRKFDELKQSAIKVQTPAPEMHHFSNRQEK
ncbi:hypothetical protein KB976_004388 [Vibrio parahaemolyticus]|nr:hypothetical protein [Vibrio parahaemolyticus]